MAQCARVEYNQLFYIHSLQYPLSIVVFFILSVDIVILFSCLVYAIELFYFVFMGISLYGEGGGGNNLRS